MIGTVDCNVQAKYPSMPLDPMQAYVGSPSSIRVRNVPKRIGDWCIRSVQFVAIYPDSTIKTAQCKLVGGVWVGTIEGTQISGRSEKGYSIFASGIDENGDEVNGYCLGKGDIEIFEADGTLDPTAPSYYVHLLSAESTDPKEGDLWQTSGTYYIWQNGQAWAIGDDSGLIGQLSAELSTKADLSALDDYALSADVSAALEGKRGLLDLSVYNDGIAPWTMTFSGIAPQLYEWDQTKQAWEYSSGEVKFQLIFDSLQSKWHIQQYDAEYDVWVDAAEPLEAAEDALRLEFGSGQVFTRPVVEGVYPTQDTLVKVSQLNVGLGMKQNNISANGILSGDGNGNVTSADMSMYIKQYGYSVFNGLTALGSNSIEGYATTQFVQDAIHYNITAKNPILTESDTVATFNFDANAVNNILLKSVGNNTQYVTSAYFYFPQSIVDKVRDFIVDVNLNNDGELKYYCYGNQLSSGANEQMTLYTDDGTMPVLSAEGRYSFSFTEIEQQTQNDEVVASKWMMSVKQLSAVGGV